MEPVKVTLNTLLFVLVATAFSGCETHNDNLPGASPLAATLSTDWDGDGLPNASDNCPRASNPDQTDTDGDGIGDACDWNVDTDADGIDDGIDNCPIYNPSQADTDQDGIGDACDNDIDGDGITNTGLANLDNCPYVANPDQQDTDNDGVGDACQNDQDGDGIPDQNDNCPSLANPDQQDTDNDNIGNLCDTDIDNDGINNPADKCPTVAGTGADGCPADNTPTTPANPDGDDDSDGVLNGVDNCPAVSNADQKDTDGDGLGDVCDDDSDGDGVVNTTDNCPLAANADQTDADGDGMGDACDTDGFTCSATGTYQPLLATSYNADSSSTGLCIGCNVSDANNLLDDDSTTGTDTHATVTAPIGLLGSSISLQATAQDTSHNITGTGRIGFVVSSDNSPLLNLGLLDRQVSISLLDDGAVVASTNGGGNLLQLGLLGIGTANTNQRFLSVPIDSQTPAFDSIRLTFDGGLAAVGETLNVHRACMGP